ncbi:tautomerase family protein [Undibacterium parvum]|uniref:Tautomerase family protein n=1 Tax=Undibacterium parvum TaxID=401471 RepID=A0A3Q9BR89_9BURK|nr:tautomerase family protein [Undibacterium parvum]AZP11828.1 tautomerase family protein [Undibacterium parvum]
MPLITISVCKPKSNEFKSLILDTIHLALQHVGVPATDKFQRVLELDAEDFRFDTGYPDVQGARTSDFVLIEILWSLGRSVKVKKEFLSFLMQEFSKKNIQPENVMLVFKETQWENWSFSGGRLLHT